MEDKSIKSQVAAIIQKRWEELRNPKTLISSSNIEKQTNQGYNGRQLLELFQNCEDEGASKVKIHLDTENKLLEISNDGINPFSVKGYDSIFYPGLTSKVSSGYIGNKGLGFRSIINWADEISIISNDFKLLFNKSLKKDILLNKIGYSEDDLDEIRKLRKLNSDVYPLPLLNCCEILDLDFTHKYTTTISIRYKDDTEIEEQIISQLESINTRTLLFLQNINTIEIDGDVISTKISIIRKVNDKNNIEIIHNGISYFVISDEGVVDENLVDDKESSEPKRYSVKIAFNYDLSFDDNVLYNYFKTQIPFELPFVAHASLELDQNRNHSTESKVNPFVLNKLFELHLKLIEILKVKHQKSWLPYKSINNDFYRVYKPYSDIIDENRNTFKVYPTLSGKYVNLELARNLGNDIARFIEENGLEEVYEMQVISCDSSMNPHQYVNTPSNFKTIIESLAENLNYTQRAELVRILLSTYPREKFCVLVDEKDKPIETEDYVYTDKTTGNESLEIPYYSSIRFIHPELYQALIQELFLQSETHKSRSLEQKLSDFSNIHSFEPQKVIRNIIRETIEYLKKHENEKSKIIKEFYQILYHYFLARGVNPKLSYDSFIPCLNVLGELVDIKRIVLSDEFEIGEVSYKIFNKLYDDEFIIAPLKKFGLAEENREQVENFLVWLGINQLTIIEKITSDIDRNYLRKINYQIESEIDGYLLYGIRDLDRILKNNLNNINDFIVWLSYENTLKEIFNNYTSKLASEEFLRYFYYRSRQINYFENFIYYKISRHSAFEDYLITNKREEWFNPFNIDYDYITNLNTDLDRLEINRILSFLGAKNDFNDLDIRYLRRKTQELAERNNHKGAQVFYKNLVGHYKKNFEQILDVELYAKQGEAIVVKKANEIFFSDRIQLPEALTNRFPIFYFPSRSGGISAIELFGLNDLNELEFKIEKVDLNEQISQEFEKFIKEIKPFILAFRLNGITKEKSKINQVQQLNNLKIDCCKTLICSIDEEVFEVEPYSYVYSNNSFYLNIPANTSLKDLRQDKKFRDNLSDIFLKVFDTLSEKKTFESIILQSRADNIYDINNELAVGTLEEAQILLGEISIRLSIWKSIFKLKNIDLEVDLNETNVEENITKFFPNIVKELMFYSNDNLRDLERIRKVFRLLEINLKEYNQVSDHKLSFDLLFTKELNDFYNERKKLIKNHIWKYLSKRDREEQSKFLDYLHKVEQLSQNFLADEDLPEYDFNHIVLEEIKGLFPFISSIDSNIEDYDLLEKVNSKNFSSDELMAIRKDEQLNSLSYFEGHIDYIKTMLSLQNIEHKEEIQQVPDIDLSQKPELLKEAKLVVSTINKTKKNNTTLWLGKTRELPDEEKKKLGNKVEDVVKKYLDNRPELYGSVELISKTSEGENYDIRYFDLTQKSMKYIECKYFNGFSFTLSRAEKEFAESYADRYEIWLVNKDSKIYQIKNINELGELQPSEFKVFIKAKEHEFSN